MGGFAILDAGFGMFDLGGRALDFGGRFGGRELTSGGQD